MMFGYMNMPEAERDKFIYRIVPLRRLKSILLNKELGLLNPKMWEKDDPYENFLMNQNITLKSGKKVSFRESTKNLFGLCWTRNSNSDYAWKVYARSNNGEIFVQIKTKPSRILEELDYLKSDLDLSTLQIGKITYVRWQKLKAKYESRRTVKPLELITNYSCFEKRHEYRHEREVRLLLRYNTQNASILNIKFNLNGACNTLMLDPRLPFDEFSKIKSEIKGWGFEGRVYRSTLYTPPKMNLVYDKLND